MLIQSEEGRGSTFTALDLDPKSVQKAYGLLDAQIGFALPGDRLRAWIWGKNLTDKYALANTIISAPLYSFVSVGSLRPPRTYGVTLGVDF